MTFPSKNTIKPNSISRNLPYKIGIVLIILLSLSVSAFSQTDIANIYGVVRDNNGGAIPSAIIRIKGENTFTQSDVNGNYLLEIPANRDLTITASFINYSVFSRSINLEPGTSKKINIKLKIKEIGAVDIYGQRKERINNMDPISAIITKKIPSPNGGIEGIIKSQIGVRSSNELSSTYSVRGGNFDENLVYVNDIEVYRPFLSRSGQQEGLSFPNPDMTSSILFSAGGFDAKYGDKMSSVLDIKYKRPTSTSASILLSMLGGSVHLGTSSKSSRLKQITGFRYKTNQYLLGSLETTGEYMPRFIDLQSYWSYSLSDEFTLNFLGNYSSNVYRFKPEDRRTNFGSINQALRLSVFFDGQEKTSYETYFAALSSDFIRKKLVLKLTSSIFKTYESESFDILGRYRIDELERDLGSEEFGEAINNIGIGGYLNHARNNIEATVANIEHKGYYTVGNNRWNWGLKLQKEIIDDSINEWTLLDSAGYTIPNNDTQVLMDQQVKAKNSTNSDRIAAFIQDSKKWKLENKSEITLTAGLRATHWTFTKESLLSPRARISYSPRWIKRINDSTTVSRDLILRASGGYYYQQAFYREMRSLGGEINKNIKAQRSIHALLGADLVVKMWNRPFKMVTEAYYKKYDNLIPYIVDNVRLKYFATNNSKGYAQGIDFKINGEFVKGVESWASFSYLKTEEDLIDDFYIVNYNAAGETIIPGYTADQEVVNSETIHPSFIPRPTDQRLSFNLFFQDELPRNPSYKVQLNLSFATGFPYGSGINKYNHILRSSPYRRVDIGFTKQFIDSNSKRKSSKWSSIKEAWLAIEIFNLLKISNVQSYSFFKASNGRSYSVPNNLTSRRINLKFYLRF